LQCRTICLLAVAALAGCGGGGPKSDPDAIHDLLKGAANAVADRDGDKACGYLTPEAQQQVLQLAGGAFDARDCPGVVKLVAGTLAPLDRKQIEDAEPQNIVVNGTTATAEVVTPSPTDQGQSVQLTLQKIGDDWKVSSVRL
jgi:hypothetical protein